MEMIARAGSLNTTINRNKLRYSEVSAAEWIWECFKSEWEINPRFAVKIQTAHRYPLTTVS
jgi:hypothetical protein